MAMVMPEGMFTMVSAARLARAGILKPSDSTALAQSRRLTEASRRLVMLPSLSTSGRTSFSSIP